MFEKSYTLKLRHQRIAKVLRSPEKDWEIKQWLPKYTEVMQ